MFIVERQTYPVNYIHFRTIIFWWYWLSSRYQFQQNNSKTIYITLFGQLLTCIVPVQGEKYNNNNKLSSAHSREKILLIMHTWDWWLTQDPGSLLFPLQHLIYGLNHLQLVLRVQSLTLLLSYWCLGEYCLSLHLCEWC